ncbi:hypothetical protein PR048_001054 [Dryococelus australis]|uniref:Uncharacterized protein n=1 Tax=Dryococelus australis TaxID=614101 RepID=A0ABQ9IGX2_9NEOP|nr:hypothetical protein PR048_001054 [Dryococelus australis]
MTLHRFLNMQKEAPIRMGYAKQRRIYGEKREIELVNYITYSSKILFGLTTKEAKQTTYPYLKIGRRSPLPLLIGSKDS